MLELPIIKIRESTIYYNRIAKIKLHLDQIGMIDVLYNVFNPGADIKGYLKINFG